MDNDLRAVWANVLLMCALTGAFVIDTLAARVGCLMVAVLMVRVVAIQEANRE